LKKLLTLTVVSTIAFTLQYTFWFGNNSIATLIDTKERIESEISKNQELSKRNSILKAEVIDLTVAEDVMEERARVELGLIGEGEVFYRIIEDDRLPADSADPSVE